MGSLILGGQLWLNQHYEMKTKEHLRDFQTRWNRLQEKYQE